MPPFCGQGFDGGKRQPLPPPGTWRSGQDGEGIEIEFLLLFLYYATLLYIASTTRIGAVLKALFFQGMAIGFFALFRGGDSGGIAGLVLIVLEAFLLKALILPYVMYRTVKKHGVQRETEPSRASFHLVLAALGAIAGSLALARVMQGAAPSLAFPPLGAALASIALGLMLIITRKQLLIHVLGYLVMENGVFLLSLSMGHQMPFLIHLGVLLDVFVGVLMMNLLLHRIISTFDDLDVRNLQELKDE